MVLYYLRIHQATLVGRYLLIKLWLPIISNIHIGLHYGIRMCGYWLVINNYALYHCNYEFITSPMHAVHKIKLIKKFSAVITSIAVLIALTDCKFHAVVTPTWLVWPLLEESTSLDYKEHSLDPFYSHVYCLWLNFMMPASSEILSSWV